MTAPSPTSTCDFHSLHDHMLLLANGIWNDSESVHGWPDYGEDWFESRGLRTKRYECETTWTLRKLPWHDRKYVEAIRTIATTTSQPVKHAALHSYACDFTLRGILAAKVPFETLILIQGATHADCERNNLNALHKKGLVRRVIVTKSVGDRVLPKSRFWPPFARVPRPLGIHGPENIAPGIEIEVVNWDAFDHSSMWMPHHINTTFEWIRSTLDVERSILSSTDPDDHRNFNHE